MTRLSCYLEKEILHCSWELVFTCRLELYSCRTEARFNSVCCGESFLCKPKERKFGLLLLYLLPLLHQSYYSSSVISMTAPHLSDDSTSLYDQPQKQTTNQSPATPSPHHYRIPICPNILTHHEAWVFPFLYPL